MPGTWHGQGFGSAGLFEVSAKELFLPGPESPVDIGSRCPSKLAASDQPRKDK
jgi:hypothetical protein